MITNQITKTQPIIPDINNMEDLFMHTSNRIILSTKPIVCVYFLLNEIIECNTTYTLPQWIETTDLLYIGCSRHFLMRIGTHIRYNSFKFNAIRY